MKKLLSVLIALIMVLGLCTACSKTPADNHTPAPEKETVYTPISILSNAIGQYKKGDVVFNISLDTVIDMEEAPGMLQIMLYIPEELMESITGAATMTHMNPNSFTGAALELAEGTDVAQFAETMKDTILNTQWMCGFPEKLMIATVGENFVVIAFGLDNEEAPLITVFQHHLKAGNGEDVAVLYTEDFPL